MDLEKLEEIGHSPLLENLKLFGGWPVLDGDKWDESEFDWYVLKPHLGRLSERFWYQR